MSAQWPFMSWPINAFHPGNPTVKDLVTTTHTHTQKKHRMAEKFKSKHYAAP